MLNRCGVITVLTLALASVRAGPAAGQEIKDHPLISRYPGSEFHRLYPPSVKAFDEIALPPGPHVKGKFTKEQRLEGKVTRLVYVNPGNRSTYTSRVDRKSTRLNSSH